MLTENEIRKNYDTYLEERRKKLEVSYLPLYATINIEARCNFKCKYCIYHGPEKKYNCNYSYTFEQIKDEIDLLLKHNIPKIHICGIGEPFLNKDIFRVFDYLNSKGQRTSILSNCSKIVSDKISKIVDADLLCFSTDLDASNKEDYNWLCGRDDFDILLDNLKKIIALKNDKKKDLKIQVNTIITKKYLHQLKEIGYILKELGVDMWALMFLAVNYEDAGFLTRENTLFNEPELVYPVVKELEEFTSKNKIDFYYPYFFKEDFPNSSLHCVKPYTQIMLNIPSPDISQDEIYGNVSPGCYPDFPSYGNLFRNSFDEIWNGKKIVDMRRKLNNFEHFRCKHLCAYHPF
ncbi:MAG TPA: radical SAM protein [bacterium]|nr:radical SAM protein [bacterium]